MATDLPRAPQPLFDRLCAPADARAEALDARGLRESLSRELATLLNTRSRLPMARFARDAAHVLDYGLPDFSALTPASGSDRDALAEAVATAIARFEPRLQHVQVTVDTRPGDVTRARVRVDAAVQLGHQLRRLQLDLDVGEATAGGSASPAPAGWTAKAA